MAEKSLRDILNDFKEGKYTKPDVIDKLFSVLQNSGDDDDIKIQVVEILVKHILIDAEEAIKWIITNEVSPNCLFELYQYLEAEGERTEELRQFMELTVGGEFLKKYDLIPKEAMALELIGRGLVWRHPVYHTNPKDWKSTPSQWTDLYDHKAENEIVFQIWICYSLNKIESKYFKLLSGLRKLYLHDCRLTDYSFLTHLTCLTVSGGDIPQISEIDEIRGLEKLVNLEELDLTYNEISEIKNLDNLVNLKKLDLSKNCIEEIKGLQNLSQLEDLDLEFNRISEIKGLEMLFNLKRLNLSENFKISEFNVRDKRIKLQKLEQFDEIEAEDLDDRTKKAISNIKKSIKIDKILKAEMAKNTHYISEIKGLENLVKLEELYLSGNRITQLNGINHLIKLKILDLSHNQISELQGIDNLIKLEKLYIADNQIPREQLKKFRKSNKINNNF